MTDKHRHSPAPAAAPGGPAAGQGAHQAFVLLRTVVTVAPILFGLDKFFDLLTNSAVRPQIGGYVVGLWLAGIAAVALARLASTYSTSSLRVPR